MSTRKPIFFTSDNHLGHAKSIEFTNRPFQHVKDMKDSMIRRFNSVVPENGLTYFLGDIGLVNSIGIKDFVDKLNGDKILILGNHDKAYNSMYSAGFTAVMDSFQLTIAKERVTFSHCPLQGVYREDMTRFDKAVGTYYHKDYKHDKFSFRDEGQFHIHGHLHSKKGIPSSAVKLSRQWDIGVDGNKYQPVSISQIESWIAFTKKRMNTWMAINRRYEINWFGEVRNLSIDGGTEVRPQLCQKTGRLMVEIDYELKYVDMLVYWSFSDKTQSCGTICHRDGVMLNNALENLKLVDTQYCNYCREETVTKKGDCVKCGFSKTHKIEENNNETKS